MLSGGGSQVSSSACETSPWRKAAMSVTTYLALTSVRLGVGRKLIGRELITLIEL